MQFKNRLDAGRKLAERLHCTNASIVALPRGGVEVAFPIAKKLAVPIGVLAVKKITLPNEPEVALGAVSACGTHAYNADYLRYTGISSKTLQDLTKEAQELAIEKEKLYGQRTDLKGKTAIIVDDGMATGYTMLAAIRSAKKEGPLKILAAVPVASAGAYKMISKECGIICLHTAENFAAVGGFYEEFPQLTDQKVKALITSSLRPAGNKNQAKA